MTSWKISDFDNPEPDPESEIPEEMKREIDDAYNGKSRKSSLDTSSTPAVTAWLNYIIGSEELSGMFLRDGAIVYCPSITEDGYKKMTKKKHEEDGPAQVREVGAARLAAICEFTYSCYRHDKDGNSHPASFPDDSAQRVVAAPEKCPHLRILKRVTHTPFVRGDGSVCDTPGYDDETGVLYLPDSERRVPAVPARPSAREVQRAAGWLDSLLGGFDFVTPTDRANYIGLLLTPMLRELVGPPFKLGCIGAPQPGSGKTLLADILRLIHGGVMRSEMPREDEELRKQVTAVLSSTTGPVIHIDNVTGKLRSSTLAGLLTSADWSDRMLGSSATVSRNNDRMWVITGNNLSLGGDLVRRALWVTIDPKVPEPHKRTDFEITDLKGWVADHREELLWSLLVLVRHWVVQGEPVRSVGGSDGYDRWIKTVDGVLSCAGISGSFDGAEAARQTVGEDDTEWAEFLAAIWGEFGNEPWTVRELLDKVHDTPEEWGGVPGGNQPISLDALPADLAEKFMKSPTGVSKSLGRWLMNHDGRWAGEFVVRLAGQDRRNMKKWKVTKQ